MAKSWFLYQVLVTSVLYEVKIIRLHFEAEDKILNNDSFG